MGRIRIRFESRTLKVVAGSGINPSRFTSVEKTIRGQANLLLLLFGGGGGGM